MQKIMNAKMEKINCSKDWLMLSVTVFIVLFLHTLILIGIYFISILPIYSVSLWSIIIGLGFTTGPMFIIGHDAAHCCLFKSKRVNHILAQICFLPSAQSRVLWQRAHNQLHHGYTNFRGKDPTYSPRTVEEYKALPFAYKIYYRIKRTIPGLFLIYLVDVWFVYTFTSDWARENRRKYIMELLVIACYFVLLSTMVILAANDSYILRIFLAIVLPFIIWNYIMAFVTYLQHTHPDVPWFDDNQEWRKYSKESLSVHVLFPEWLDVAFLRALQHPVHHKNASIPWFHLKEANKIISAQDNIAKLKFTWKDISRVFQVCKLYDYQNKKWVPYPA